MPICRLCFDKEIMSEIAYKLDEDKSAAFLRILVDTYREYNQRPALCRLACVEFEGARYLAAINGFVAIFLPVPKGLQLGDYEGVPYLVKCVGDDQLHRLIIGLFKLIKDHTEVAFDKAGSVVSMRAYIVESFFDTEELTTDVLLAHIDDGKFTLDLEKPHAFIIDRELYDFAFDAIGYFDKVRYKEASRALCFMNTAGRGFAIIMPMGPYAKIKVVK